MNSLNISSYDKVEQILLDSQSALWRLEIQKNMPPRLFGDKAMHKMFEASEDLTAEEFYVHWDSTISDEYKKLIQTALGQILSGTPSEIIFAWNDSKGCERYAQCGGFVLENTPDSIIVHGYQNDVTKTKLSKIQQLNFENLPYILKENYYSIYSFNFKSGTFQLEQSTDSILYEHKITTSTHYKVMYNYFINNLIAEQDREAFAAFFDVEKLQEEFKTIKEKTLVVSKLVDNAYRFTEMKFYPIQFEDGEVVRALLVAKDVHDVIEKERQQQRIIKETSESLQTAQTTLSHVIYDKLTGLFSKGYFNEQAGYLIQENPSKEFVFIAVNVDDFKSYNSIAGTPKGDEVIKFMASYLDEKLKNLPNTLYTRHNGASFAIITEYNPEALLKFENNFIQALNNYSPDITIKLLFGEYIILDHSEEITIIHDKAILATKTCKDHYGTHIAQYTEKMDEEVKLNRTLSQDMQKAIQNNEFLIYFQPKYDAQTLKISGAEALVRWNHKHQSILSPAIFIPLFEQNGFIRHLDFNILEQTCAFIKEHNIKIPLSVNISRANIYSSDLRGKVMQVLEKYNVKPEQICLEFTESAYYNDISTIQKILKQLQDSGLIISMDDFGTGYSSLSMLKNVNVNELKIDASFVDFVHGDEKSLFILEMIVQMSKKLNLHVTVEGIETLEQMKIVKELGCNTVQGYYMARPMPKDDFLKLLKEEK